MPELTIHVRPDAEEWGSTDDDRWRTDLAELQHQLQRELPDETVDPGPAEDRRGAAELTDVVLALGSAGAMTAMTEVIKAWIGAKPGRRKVVVSIDEDGAKRDYRIEADGLGAQELGAVATAALGGAADGGQGQG